MNKSIFDKLNASLAAFLKYGPLALTAVQGVELAVGAGNGATKKQLAVAAILSVAHVGETVPLPQVQIVAALVDTIVGTMNAMGGFGKTPAPASVAVAALAS